MKKVSQGVEKEVGVLRDSAITILRNTNTRLEELLLLRGNELKSTISDIEIIKGKADQEVKSYFKRHKIIDYLVYIDLLITPIIFLILIYILVLK